MNQLLKNIAGGIVHQIRHEKRTTISEVILRGKREILSKINKIGIGFISIFLLKARVSYLTILSLPLEDETDQFVICLVLSVSLFRVFDKVHWFSASSSIHQSVRVFDDVGYPFCKLQYRSIPMCAVRTYYCTMVQKIESPDLRCLSLEWFVFFVKHSYCPFQRSSLYSSFSVFHCVNPVFILQRDEKTSEQFCCRKSDSSTDLYSDVSCNCLQTLTSYFFWYSNFPANEQ